MIHLGVDQTGQVKGGQPAPLPCCWLEGSTVLFALAPSLSLKGLEQAFGRRIDPAQTVIAVDAVLGLPQMISVPWREALERARSTPGWGLNTAAAFFREFSDDPNLTREIDRAVGAQSLFKTKPYQRNIQTGTFRVWKELGANPDWFSVPHLGEAPQPGRVPLYEGYPSLAWRLLLGCRTRAPGQLMDKLQTLENPPDWTPQLQAAVNQNPNLADALLLSLAARQYAHPLPYHARPSEGWILGAEFSGRCATSGQKVVDFSPIV